MRVLDRWITALLLMAGSLPTVSQSAEARALPFTLSWTHGHCLRCKTATSLVDVQFVSPKQAWAIGYVPPGETGAGDFSILHSRDGGAHWTELARSYQHNDAPLVSFANRREGWTARIDTPTGEERFAQTRDGGRHWQRLPLRDRGLGNIQNLGGGSGLAAGSSPGEASGTLIATVDHGQHWHETSLPAGFRAERMAFATVDQGILAGCRDNRLVAISTSDGGRHWSESPLGSFVSPAAPTDTPCDFEIDDLSLIGTHHVWLLANKHSFKNGDTKGAALILESIDGGIHWKTSYQATFNGFSSSLSSLSFIDERLGFATEADAPGSTDKASINTSALLYTTDGGKVWQKAALPDEAQGCHAYAHQLYCAAGSEGRFEVLKVTPK